MVQQDAIWSIYSITVNFHHQNRVSIHNIQIVPHQNVPFIQNGENHKYKQQ